MAAEPLHYYIKWFNEKWIFNLIWNFAETMDPIFGGLIRVAGYFNAKITGAIIEPWYWVYRFHINFQAWKIIEKIFSNFIHIF